jgi:UPF0755 protein
MKKIYLFFSIIGLLSTFVFFQIFFQKEHSSIFKIHQGEAFPSINQRLYHEKIIPSTSVFYHYVKYKKSLERFKAGLYEVSSNESFASLLHKFTKGNFLTKKITIPEGYNHFDIAEILHKENLCSKEHFFELTKSSLFLKKYNIPSVEGYLFPSTYFIPLGSSCHSIVSSFIEETLKLKKKLHHPKFSFHEILTLASIVQKETGPSEEKIIAGVFLNRLKKSMRLQSDPTVIYGFLPEFSGRIRKHHLEFHHPFNTYRISGLPPYPIANPGIKSILSILEPDHHDYLFFVSKNNGTHIFTKTYKEHSGYVDTYQIKKKN